MHKLVLAVLLVVACASASSVSDHIAQVAIPATRLETGSSLGSVSLVSSHGSHGGCAPAEPPCQAPTDGHGHDGVSVDDAIKPVDDWLKDFKKRAMGGGGENLYAAAKNTVAPLIKKLKMTMKRAQEKLADSNKAILKHVEETTVNHIYQLLKADKAREKAKEAQEEHVQKIMDAQEKQKEAAHRANAMLGLNSETAKKLEHVMGSSHGAVPSQSVIDKIAHVLSESSSAAAKSISSALKKAAHESSHSLSHHSGSSSHHSGSSSHHSGSSSKHSSGSSSHHSSSHF
jgi:hypothetical protein